MFIPVERSSDKTQNYKQLLENIRYYMDKKDAWYSVLANAASVIDYFLDDVNWVGFYVMDGERLYLGPFQGKAACTQIMLGSGVVGHAAKTEATVRVDDVETFEGHIACDGNSASEIVVPMFKDGTLYGTLDIDAPIKARFDATDQHYLEEVVKVIIDNIT